MRTIKDKTYWKKTPLSEIKKVTEGPPIDFSFKDLKTVIDVVHEEPVSGKPAHPSIPAEDNAVEYIDKLYAECMKKLQKEQQPSSEVELDALSSKAPSSPPAGTNGSITNASGTVVATEGLSRSGTQNSRGMSTARDVAPPYVNSVCVRLSNNVMTSLNRLDRLMYHLLDVPSLLSWLDLSCNKLTNIESVILSLTNLQVLYLHGNEVTTLSEVDKLGALKNLKKLTLHGNPISEQKHYKFHVCTRIPSIQNLDFSAVTKLERQAIDAWLAAHRKRSDG